MTTKTDILDGLLEALEERQKSKGGGVGYKHDVTGSPTTNYMYGPGGIFGVSGLERDVISTRIQPRGLAGTLRALPSLRTNPLFAYLTGQLADVGSEKTEVCDPAPTAGLVKSCIQTAQFGRYERATKQIELNRLGQQTDRGNFLDLRLVNDPLLQDMGGILGMNIPGSVDFIRDVLMSFMEVGSSFQNILTRQTYIGNPANNTGGGGYQEFPGLDILIGTNKVDALTGANCPSLDSDIKDFGCNKVDEFSPDIVEYITYMMRYLRHNADRQNLMPVDWVITMRRELFWEITAIWPCSYLTYRCAFRDGGFERVNVDASDAVAMRDNMRQGNYLLIDGERVPVVIDDGITELTNVTSGLVDPGCFCSDIYFIPLSVQGGYLSTYWEYLDFQNGALVGAGDGRVPQDFWTDGGRFLWTPSRTLWCLLWTAKIEPRVILRTPQLAGRIQNVQYCPLQHTRDPFPSDPYFTNGGETVRSGPSLYSDWNLPA